MDVDNLDPGIDFVEAIKASVGCCDVLIAVIGKHWLVSADEEGRRRIDNPEDFVRIEIGAVVLIGLAILRVQPPAPNSLISPPSIPIVSGPAPSEGKQPAGQPAPLRAGSPQSVHACESVCCCSICLDALLLCRNFGLRYLKANTAAGYWKISHLSVGRQLSPKQVVAAAHLPG